jgi:hypothetical protein
VAKGKRSKRQRVKQTEFSREREPLCCVHFCPLGFHHFRSLPIAIVVAIMPHRCLDVKRAKVVIFSQNIGFLIIVCFSVCHHYGLRPIARVCFG